VGRSHHRAYAYLVVPDERSMTRDARKRLEAIASLEELGAGFTLATHDLEIRGAGELLGDEQSGEIQSVGFSLYSELLARAVAAMREGKEIDLEGSLHQETDIELHISALIPEDWLGDIHTRLTLYKRIASAPDHSALRDLQVEMIDRFGLLPQPTKHLFQVAELRQKDRPFRPVTAANKAPVPGSRIAPKSTRHRCQPDRFRRNRWTHRIRRRYPRKPCRTTGNDSKISLRLQTAGPAKVTHPV